MKIRKLELKTIDGLKYAELVEVVIQGSSTPEEVLKAVKIADELESNPTSLLLDNESYQYLTSRLGKVPWNATKENRKALAAFITDVRDLKEEDAKLAN